MFAFQSTKHLSRSLFRLIRNGSCPHYLLQLTLSALVTFMCLFMSFLLASFFCFGVVIIGNCKRNENIILRFRRAHFSPSLLSATPNRLFHFLLCHSSSHSTRLCKNIFFLVVTDALHFCNFNLNISLTNTQRRERGWSAARWNIKFI